MLKAYDPNELRVLIEEALEEGDRKLSSMAAQVEKYHGPFWSGRSSGSALGKEYAAENTYYEYMSAMVPRLVQRNPRVKVSSRRTADGPGHVADAIRHGLNRVVVDQRLDQTLRALAVDMLFSWGVALVKEKPRKGVVLHTDDPIYPAKPTWPVAERISQKRFFMDPEAYDIEKTRFRGHIIRIDRDDLVKRAKDNPSEGWDLAEIERLAPTDSRANDQQPDMEQRHTREQIELYEVWVPEIELPESLGHSEGFHGTTYTLAVAQNSNEGSDGDAELGDKAGFVRAPRPFYGPRTGPYVIFGAYSVPNSPFPLSPLCAVEGQILDLNDQVLTANRSMSRFKKVLAVNSASTAEKLNAQDGHVVVIPFDQGKAMAQELEFGGHSDKQLEHMGITKERVDRTLGMDETMRGNVAGGATATEHSLANESSMARIGEIQESFLRSSADVLKNMAHYMYHSDTIVFPMGDEILDAYDIVVKDGETIQPWYRGGTEGSEEGFSFEDLELDIEPYSMARTNEGLQQQRALQKHAILMESLPMMAQYPDFPWKEHFKSLGEAMNTEDLEEMVPAEMLERLAEQASLMFQVEVQASAPQAAPDGMLASQAGQPTKPAGGRQEAIQGPSAAKPSKPTSMAGSGGGPPTGARAGGQGMAGQKSGGMAAAGAKK